MGELTLLLSRAGAGDDEARRELFAIAYADLHAQAHARLRRGGRHTLLDTTALVHESFLRFVQVGQLDMPDRRQFFAYAASVMRSVIVDHARRRLAERRGGGVEHVDIDTELGERLAGADVRVEEVIHVHEMLQQLEAADPRLAHVVEMRYFVGMSEPEVAHLLGLDVRTVQRDWRRARLLLAAAMA